MEISYFSDPHLQKILANPAHDRPVAVHIEAQSLGWLDDRRLMSKHARLCTEILGGPLVAGDARSWDYGLLDRYYFLKETFQLAAMHPATRLITVSTSYDKIGGRVSPDPSCAGVAPLILKAVGNEGKNWAARRENDSLSMLHVQPGFLRVGEAFADGNPHPHSQTSGPAFTCAHPFYLDPDYGFAFYPAQREIDAFLDHARSVGFASVPVAATGSAGQRQTGKTGTSYSAPHAGAMIMHYSADMAGLTSGDILPAVLLAAQDRKPGKGDLVRNQAGLVFDCGHRGFGFLDDAPLARRLGQVRDLARESGGCSRLALSAATGAMHIDTPHIDGPIANLALLLQFRTDHHDKRAEGDVPLHVHLKSPDGTKIRLPLLINRMPDGRYDGSIRAGFQTAAFLGEKPHSGQWEVSCPWKLWGRYRIDRAEIVIHSLPEGSPGAVLLDRYRPA